MPKRAKAKPHQRQRNLGRLKPSTLELEITALAYGGRGIARKEGKVYFVEHAVVGDKVAATVTKDKKKWAEAKVTKLLETSSKRRQAQCEYFGKCGGCDWQNMEYSEQVYWKKDYIVKALKKIGQTEATLDGFYESSSHYGFRNRIQLQFTIQDGKAFLGYFSRSSHKIIKIDFCEIAANGINKAIKEILSFDFASSVKNLDSCRLELQEDIEGRVHLNIADNSKIRSPDFKRALNKIAQKSQLLIVGAESFVYDEHCNKKYLTRPGIFQQINLELNHSLRDLIKNIIDQINPKKVLDLYCGSGNLSLALSGKSRVVKGIELNKTAIEIARENQSFFSPEGLSYQTADSADFLAKQAKEFDADLIICDPPRAGLEKALDFIADLECRTIIYVACDPNSLAKDFKELKKAGYNIEKLYGFDFFPQSYHIETVALLQLA